MKVRNMQHNMVLPIHALIPFYIGIQFIETSALDSTNVDKAFYKVVSDIYQ
jgi:hypothetical protein